MGEFPKDVLVEAGDGFEDSGGMDPVGRLIFEDRGVESLLDSDDKDSAAGLWEPVDGVEHHGANAVASLREGLVEGSVVRATLGGDESDDVFEADDFGWEFHLVNDAEPFPKHAAAAGLDSFHATCEREVLAGKASPREVGGGDRVSRDLTDVGEREMIGAVVGLVDMRFAGRDVVGPNNI